MLRSFGVEDPLLAKRRALAERSDRLRRSSQQADKRRVDDNSRDATKKQRESHKEFLRNKVAEYDRQKCAAEAKIAALEKQRPDLRREEEPQKEPRKEARKEPHKPRLREREKEHVFRFEKLPLGLTLELRIRNDGEEPVVVNLPRAATGVGEAQRLGVCIGDVLVRVNESKLKTRSFLDACAAVI